MQRFQEDQAGATALVMMGCAEKLHIPPEHPPEYEAAAVQCASDQMKVISNEALARIDARELAYNEAGQFLLNQAVSFLKANSEAARIQDSAELIRVAVQEGRRVLLSKRK